MKVSFDFDSTLSRDDVQKFAKELINKGIDVWIVTSRFSDNMIKQRGFKLANNSSVFNVAKKCGIKKENIFFTNMNPKVHFLFGKDFIFHLDDDDIELMDLKNSDEIKCIGVDVCSDNWKEICLNILDNG